MFRTKKAVPAADIEKYLPELYAYAREHYKPGHEADISYSLPPEPPDSIRYSRADKILDESDKDRMPFSMEEMRKDPAVLDSPAMKRYYHSWEKKKSVTKTFSSEVVRMVREKYTKTSAFYVPAGIDKRTFHKIRSDYLYKPSRNTAMKCCLGLKLNCDEANDLLQLAGYSFSPSDPADLVVLFCLEKKIWDLASVNYLMDSFDLKDLDGFVPE